MDGYLRKPGAPATGGEIENHRCNMAECRGQLVAARSKIVASFFIGDKYRRYQTQVLGYSGMSAGPLARVPLSSVVLPERIRPPRRVGRPWITFVGRSRTFFSSG